MDLTAIKQRFDIIGTDAALDRAIEVAVQVASTDLSVLITGESGVGKEVIPKIIHHFSPRKHENYFAVNCGAIPEGTIDSELFGHEKGSFTGATDARKGYFEVADKGTLFLDEVAELPLSTQARLLRVLQSGEFIRVGSSKTLKTDVRIVAATNVNLMHAISTGKFREDLYYRLNTVPVRIPSLRERKGDIYILFRKFAFDFAEKYTMPTVQLSPDARTLLEEYRWPGNVRQLKSIAEQISILERDRIITADTLAKYIPREGENLPSVASDKSSADYMTDRDIIFKYIYMLKREIDSLKAVVHAGQAPQGQTEYGPQPQLLLPDSSVDAARVEVAPHGIESHPVEEQQDVEVIAPGAQMDGQTLQELARVQIEAALRKHNGKRKAAAEELGISERTLYRKIKEYNLI